MIIMDNVNQLMKIIILGIQIGFTRLIGKQMIINLGDGEDGEEDGEEVDGEAVVEEVEVVIGAEEGEVVGEEVVEVVVNVKK